MTESMTKFLFQYCPKIAVVDCRMEAILLCRRKGEMDYDGVYSFIGGKMEHTDESIQSALSREKSEEVGPNFRISLLTSLSVNVLFAKKDGSKMILPHYYAEYLHGEICLSDEYDDYKWVEIKKLVQFTPKIDNVAWITDRLCRMRSIARRDEFVEI